MTTCLSSKLSSGRAAVLLAAVFVQAAVAQPRTGYVYPAGGQAGTTVQVTVGGQRLGTVHEAIVSGKGIHATVLESTRPLNPKQALLLRDELKELVARQKAAGAARGQASTRPAWTPADDARLAAIQKQLSTYIGRPATPALAETCTVQIVLDADAPPGERELRLHTSAGLSSPLIFCVGQLPEFAKPALRPIGEGAKRNSGRAAAEAPPTTVTLPVTVNGQIAAGTTDRYRFRARRGQRLVAMVQARSLIPYLADAVPGWFQATLRLTDAAGHEVAYDDDDYFRPDPLLLYQVPRDGEYEIEIGDSLFRGREDFVYRISLGELPVITGVFPLGGAAGERISLELIGWNLPTLRLSYDASDKKPGVHSLVARKGTIASNPVPFAVGALPDSMEQEPNNEFASAQDVSLPALVNGRIVQSGDTDLFGFEGHAGDEVVAEVWARRLGSPLDSTLRLLDSAGTTVAAGDDVEDKAAGLLTHHADSLLRATLPAEGRFFIQIADAQHKGGREYGYRLRISRPMPDFELRVVPSSVAVRPNGTFPLTVHVLRREGFSGEIALALQGAPPGFRLNQARIPGDKNEVKITISTPRRPPSEAIALVLEGAGGEGPERRVHQAVPAEDRTQAFIYHHLVPSRWLMVTFNGPRP